MPVACLLLQTQPAVPACRCGSPTWCLRFSLRWRSRCCGERRAGTMTASAPSSFLAFPLPWYKGPCLALWPSWDIPWPPLPNSEQLAAAIASCLPVPRSTCPPTHPAWLPLAFVCVWLMCWRLLPLKPLFACCLCVRAYLPLYFFLPVPPLRYGSVWCCGAPWPG